MRSAGFFGLVPWDWRDCGQVPAAGKARPLPSASPPGLGHCLPPQTPLADRVAPHGRTNPTKATAMTSTPHKERQARIRALNDQLRCNFATNPAQIPGPFKVLFTAGLKALDEAAFTRLVEAVRTFNAFTDDNDPWAEHDFGAIEIAGERYFFKIDYYDRMLSAGSPDAADPAVTVRVLTIMRADEY